MASSLRRKTFAEKLATEWLLPVHNLNVPISANKPLETWICPQEIVQKGGYSALNWATWLKTTQSFKQAGKLLQLISTDPSFFMWRHVHVEGSLSPQVKEVEGDDRLRLCEQILEGQLVDQVLRDECGGEERRPLCADKKTARMKLSSADKVFVLFDERSEVDGIFILGGVDAYKTSFRYPTNALKLIQNKGASIGTSGTVFIDLILSDRCSQKKTGTTLMNHVLALYPNSLLIVHCPMVLSTMRFYYNNGFHYSDMGETSANLLLDVVERVSGAVRMWNSGFSHLTYVNSSIEDTRVRISSYTGSLDSSLSKSPGPYHIKLGDPSSLEQDVERIITDGHDRIWLWAPDAYDVQLLSVAVRAAEFANKKIATDWRVDYMCILIKDVYVGEVAHAISNLTLPIPRTCLLEPPVDEDELFEDDMPSFLEEDSGDAFNAFEEEEDVGLETEEESPPYEEYAVPVTPVRDTSATDKGSPVTPFTYEEFDEEENEVIREYFYNSKTRELRRQRVSEIIEFLLNDIGLMRRDMTADMRNVFSVLFDDIEITIDKSLKGVAFIKKGVKGLDAVTHACVFRVNEIIHFQCPGDGQDDVTKMFLLMMRVQRPNELTVRPGTQCNTSVVVLTKESREHLFEMVISHSARRRFVNSCLFRNANLKTGKPSSIVSICKGKQRAPASNV
ncbi:MAG: hypothetical protein CBC65_000965 [Rhodothermaceae bacterium TMED105]|jgi:hypothetical protein|nr:MAG: hypothetical protein CBC65_000965 [Rhodothermaceae bacterium TMED105]